MEIQLPGSGAIRGPNPEDYIQIDYGRVTSAKSICLLSANPAKPEDYIHQGELKLSLDGENWFVTYPISHPEETIPIDNPFRYIRLASKIRQESWILIRELILQ